ncbi:MAG: metallophosphoesterase, partial [Thermodesulfovibrionales bacterium]
MTFFLSVFFMLYGGLHLYAFVKARAALGFGFHTGLCLCLFMAAMTVAPAIVHLLEKAGSDLLARLVSFVGYSWMGILFLFCSLSLVIDFYHLLLFMGRFFLATDLSHLKVSGHYAFVIPLLFALSIAIYGYFEARDIRTEKLTIRTSKIPKEVGSLKIVQISDVHLGLIVRQDRLERILQKVRTADPDILVSTGDLVDGQINGLPGLAELFREINPRYGKFAITGNH